MKLWSRRRKVEPETPRLVPAGSRVTFRPIGGKTYPDHRGTVIGFNDTGHAWIAWNGHPDVICTYRQEWLLVLPFAPKVEIPHAWPDIRHRS
jgi:hypothetical protein